MKNRREWERFHKDTPAALLSEPTEFGHWALPQVGRGSHTIDIGAGSGRDVLALARSGRPATGLDYARAAFGRVNRMARAEDVPATFAATNLYDRRDAISRAALLANMHPGRRVVISGGLLDSLEPDDRDNFYPMLRILLAGGGLALLEFGHDVSAWKWDPARGGKRYAVPVAEVTDRMSAMGGRVVEAASAPATDGIARTRLVVEWSA
jgi:SAM-dependent methyltransferase